MTKSELVKLMAGRHFDWPADDTRLMVDVILDVLGTALAEGRRIEIRGFGSFAVSRRRARVSRNPRTGQPITVPAKHVPHFQAGKRLRERVIQARPAG